MIRMIPSSLLIVVLSLASVRGLQKKTFDKKTTRSEFGKRLNGHVFMTAKGLDPQHCLADCWQVNDRCQSFNFIVDEKMCELNNKSKVNAPNDFTDRDRSVYCTNPAFGKGAKLELPRHNFQYPDQPVGGYCASDPCWNGGICVPNDKTGFRCAGCNSGFYGLRCEQRLDPCQTSPCLNGGTCKSSNTGYNCQCPFPFYGPTCHVVRPDYQFDFDGISAFAKSSAPSSNYRDFVVWFWFKTEQVLSYFCSFVPNDPGSTKRLTVWKNGTTFYVELIKDQVVNFSFPYSHTLDSNSWHAVSVVFTGGTWLEFYLDGRMREARKQSTVGGLFLLPPGDIYLGVHKINSSTSANFFNGSITAFDIRGISSYTDADIKRLFLVVCPPSRSSFGASPWHGFRYASLHSCSLRYPINGIVMKQFTKSSKRHWVELAVASPPPLSNLTLSFWFYAEMPESDWQIVCYGENENCEFSVVIERDLDLLINISNIIVKVDLLPIFENVMHHVAITWTSKGGVVEVIIDAVLQSRLANVSKDVTIPPQSKFLVGGSQTENKNFEGSIFELNMWDEVLPVEMLYYFTASAGNDKGNVVTWKDSDDSHPSIRDQTTNLMSFIQRVPPYGYGLRFPSSAAGNFSFKQDVSGPVNQLTFTMWVKIEAFPAVLATVSSSRSPQEFLLTVDSQHNVELKMLETNITLANKVDELRVGWHFIAVSWSDNGELAFQLNGVHTQVSSNFKVGHSIYNNPGYWYIGNINQSFQGYVRETNFWQMALPMVALRAMSRGCQRLTGDRILPNFPDFTLGKKGMVQIDMIKGYTFSKVYLVQKMRDQYCNDHLDPDACLYYARLGLNDGREWGCFCEGALSNDGNIYSYAAGNYVLTNKLRDIELN